MTARGEFRHLQWWTLLLGLICIGAAASLRAAGEYRTLEVEGLKIIIDSEWASHTAPGYVPVRFDITNLGEARAVEIAAETMRFFRGLRGGMGGGITARQTVRLARGDRVRLTLPVPVLADSENIRFELRENGRTLERFSDAGFQGKSLPDDTSALIVADPGTPFGKAAAGWLRKVTPSLTASRSGVILRASPGGPVSIPPLDFALEPSRLPTNWLGFTSLRAVVIGAGEWSQLTDAQKDALLTWTACGGDLLFVGGDLAALFPAAQHPPGIAAGTGTAAYYFGRLHLPTVESMSARGLTDVLAEAAAAQDDSWALPANRAKDWGAIAARGFRLPIPGVDGVPARAYVSILVFFTILIGPLNYWFFWRVRRQVLLVLTTPIISALFIALLAGYVLAGEGIGVRARAVSFTMLDQVRKQAATRASMSLYAAGTTPAGGLRFQRDVAVFPIGTDGGGSREQQVLDLTEAQRYTAGAIRARSPSNLEQIGFRPARERLDFSREGAALSVANGLGATVTTLLYDDGGQRYQLTAPLPAGGGGVLQRVAGNGSIVVPTDLPQAARLQYFFDHPAPHSYLAIIERSPFWDPGVAGVAERGGFHLVIGWPEGQP